MILTSHEKWHIVHLYKLVSTSKMKEDTGGGMFCNCRGTQTRLVHQTTLKKKQDSRQRVFLLDKRFVISVNYSKIVRYLTSPHVRPLQTSSLITLNRAFLVAYREVCVINLHVNCGSPWNRVTSPTVTYTSMPQHFTEGAQKVLLRLLPFKNILFRRI